MQILLKIQIGKERKKQGGDSDNRNFLK